MRISFLREQSGQLAASCRSVAEEGAIRRISSVVKEESEVLRAALEAGGCDALADDASEVEAGMHQEEEYHGFGRGSLSELMTSQVNAQRTRANPGRRQIETLEASML